MGVRGVRSSWLWIFTLFGDCRLIPAGAASPAHWWGLRSPSDVCPDLALGDRSNSRRGCEVGACRHRYVICTSSICVARRAECATECGKIPFISSFPVFRRHGRGDRMPYVRRGDFIGEVDASLNLIEFYQPPCSLAAFLSKLVSVGACGWLGGVTESHFSFLPWVVHLFQHNLTGFSHGKKPAFSSHGL